MAATPESRTIPEPIQRQLRQEAGFGCCMCGHPLFQYHHILGWANTASHNPADLMLLCPNHHDEAGRGSFPEAEQREWKARPFNIRRGSVHGLLRITSEALALTAGTVLFVGPGFKITVDGQPLLDLERDFDGRVLLSTTLYDSRDNLLISIRRNHWISGDALPWDLAFASRFLALRSAKGKIAIELDARMEPVKVSGRLWRNGQVFELSATRLLLNGVVQQVAFVNLGLIGASINVDTRQQIAHVVPDPAFGGFMLTGTTDLAKCLEAFATLQAQRLRSFGFVGSK